MFKTAVMKLLRGGRVAAGVVALVGAAAPALAGPKAERVGAERAEVKKAAVEPAGAVEGASGPWTPLEDVPREARDQEAWVHPVEYRAFVIDIDAMTKALWAAPLEGTPEAVNPVVIELPHPDGGYQRFSVLRTTVMEAGLAATRPDIRAFVGTGIDDPGATLRCEITPIGFTAQVLAAEGAWLIDPYRRGDRALCTSYYLRRVAKEAAPFTCAVVQGAGPAMRNMPALRGPGGAVTRRTYRFAASTTGEFTAWAGGQPQTLNVLTVMISRLSQIFEAEVAVRFVLIDGQTSIMYTDAAGDPYTMPDDDTIAINENQAATDAAVGPGAYDLGQVFHKTTPLGSHGLAGVGVVCVPGQKGRGYTAFGDPRSPQLVASYLAHEVGHQFGAHHTFNNCQYAITPETSVEPGSGSTIMSYAGACSDGRNLQPYSDPYFHAISLGEIKGFLPTATCGASAAAFNAAPAVSAGGPWVIPSRTPFTLTATGADADGDVLTYTWETIDTGPPLPLPGGVNDNGESPIIRSRPGTTDGVRTVPPLLDLLAGREPLGEALPRLSRTMHWRVTARDNHQGAGATAFSDTTVQAVDTGAPFRLTSPNGPGTFNGVQTVTWNPAGTAGDPIACANVRILLSIDGGLTFPRVLAAGVPNTGTASVVMPSVNTTKARVKIEAVGNIFFDVSDANFTIGTGGNAASFSLGGLATVVDTEGNGNGNSAADPGETELRVFIPVINSGATTAFNVSATLSSDTPTATVVSGSSAYPTIINGSTQTNLQPFVVSVSALHPCGTPVSLSLIVSSDQGGGRLRVGLRTGVVPGGGNVLTASYTAGAVNITDNDATGVFLPLDVSGVGQITDVNFTFGKSDGGSCTTSTLSPAVGLAHPFVGDLIVRLISPTGRSVVLMDRPGTIPGVAPNGSSGNNFCDTTLDDEAVGGPIQEIVTADNPYSGSFTPANPLFQFIGDEADGTWFLNVADRSNGDQGRVQFFSLEFRLGEPVCFEPSAVLGACCFADGACTPLTSAACTGAYRGDETACTPNDCPQPTGACCAAGACQTRTRAECTGVNGSYIGDNVVCSTGPCPGACCAAGGGCDNLSSADCAAAGGVFQGAGTSCSPGLCPAACCRADGVCVLAAEAACVSAGGDYRLGSVCGAAVVCPRACCTAGGQCLPLTDPFTCVDQGGTPQSPGTVCAPGLCPQPTGSCCVAEVCVPNQTAAECAAAGGAFRGIGTACTPDACTPPPPMGACCAAAGTCSLTTQPGCAAPGVYLGDSTACGAPACPPLGSCCAADGSCLERIQAGCTSGTWTAGAVCMPTNPCPPPPGACCDMAGGCSLQTQAECDGVAGSVFQGPGTACGAGVCPPAGSCCSGTGGCTVRIQVACLDAWTPGGGCSPNLCLARCCVPSGGCSVVTGAGCAGTWGLPGGCSPNPCPQPTGACCAGSGGCSVITAAQCTAGQGTFQGAGASCAPNLCPRVCCRGSACDVVTPAQCVLSGSPQAGIATAPATVCGPLGGGSACCRADYNKLLNVDLLDIFTFLQDWFDGVQYADFDGANGVDLLDIFAFITAWFAGPCS